jgi:hypothetical protein
MSGRPPRFQGSCPVELRLNSVSRVGEVTNCGELLGAADMKVSDRLRDSRAMQANQMISLSTSVDQG